MQKEEQVVEKLEDVMRVSDSLTIELLKLHRAMVISESRLVLTDQYKSLQAAQAAFNTKLNEVAAKMQIDNTKYEFNVDDMVFKLKSQG